MPTHTVYPVQLATFHNVEYSFLVMGKNFGTRFSAPSLGFLIVADEPDERSAVVVDTGPKGASPYLPANERLDDYAEEAFRRKFDELSLSPADVKHVILTHLHWDHVENIDIFPNAMICVQRRELETAAAPMIKGYYDRKDIARFVDELAPRLDLLDGDTEIVPGVEVVLVGGHTFGSQIVKVASTAGRVLIVGDVLNLYANLEGPSQKEIDPVGWAKAIRWIKRNGDIVLPGHDPEVLERHPVVGGPGGDRGCA